VYTNPVGELTRFDTNRFGSPVLIRNALNQETTFVRNEDDLVTQITDARGVNTSWCCTSLKKVSWEPSYFNTTNGGTFTTEDQHGEVNALKDGTVFTEHGYPSVTAQFTILNVNQESYSGYEVEETSAAIASPGGTWTGAIDTNPGDPEGEGILPRRYIKTSLSAPPDEILSILDEIFQEELNF
jgi:YD repeat-containing protein